AVSRNSRALVRGNERSPSGRFATSWSALHGLGPSQEKEGRPPSAGVVSVNARLGCGGPRLFLTWASTRRTGSSGSRATSHADRQAPTKPIEPAPRYRE